MARRFYVGWELWNLSCFIRHIIGFLSTLATSARLLKGWGSPFCQNPDPYSCYNQLHFFQTMELGGFNHFDPFLTQLFLWYYIIEHELSINSLLHWVVLFIRILISILNSSLTIFFQIILCVILSLNCTIIQWIMLKGLSFLRNHATLEY